MVDIATGSLPYSSYAKLPGRIEEADDSLPQEEDGKSSLTQSVFNVINTYVGLGLLSKPYAVKLGGWVSLAVLLVLTCLFNFTGKLVVRSFERIPGGRQGAPSYAELGKATLGSFGYYLVSLITSLEFFGGACMCLIIVWQCAEQLLPHVDSAELRLGVLLLCLPSV
eukprot:gene24230-29427_t